MRAHLTKCILAGLVTVLPVGGLALLLVKAEQTLRPPLQGCSCYFPGMAILAVIAGVYLLGLTVTTFVGRWVWNLLDRLLSQLPGLAVLYGTLKQILGYGSGKDALFQKVVFIQDSKTGALELGLLTEEIKLENHPVRWAVFLPGSPNPVLGRLVLIEPERCIPSEIPVDAAIKMLLSTGKTGLK